MTRRFSCTPPPSTPPPPVLLSPPPPPQQQQQQHSPPSFFWGYAPNKVALLLQAAKAMRSQFANAWLDGAVRGLSWN